MNMMIRSFFALLFFTAPLAAEIEDPRDHHYEFAHKVLVEAMRGDDFLATLEKKKSAYLKSLWRDAEKRAKDGNKLSSRGLDQRVFDLGDERAVVVVILPEPEITAEAYMVGAEFREGKLARKVYTLEKGFDRLVLAAWQDGVHLNFGEGPENDPEKFRDAIIAANK